MEEEKALTPLELEEQAWLEEINKIADEKATELSSLLNCEVEPFVFVLKPMKDAAVGFLKNPSAEQSLKIFRAMIEDKDNGAKLAARAQLVREYNGMVASDPRFMDAEGNYDPKDSTLNFSLLLRTQRVVSLFNDKFKKK